ncbi:MAG: 30S ribosome-binding factor RbfA [Bacteroidota bacterium]
METNRQKKIAGVIQKDLSEIIAQILRDAAQSNIIVSVTKVRVTPDLLQAKAYLSVFPNEHADVIIGEINDIKTKIKHQVALRTKNQLRRMPELSFYNDDTLSYIEDIEKAFDGSEDPIKNPDLLDKRKKN